MYIQSKQNFMMKDYIPQNSLKSNNQIVPTVQISCITITIRTQQQKQRICDYKPIMEFF